MPLKLHESSVFIWIRTDSVKISIWIKWFTFKKHFFFCLLFLLSIFEDMESLEENRHSHKINSESNSTLCFPITTNSSKYITINMFSKHIWNRMCLYIVCYCCFCIICISNEISKQNYSAVIFPHDWFW